MRFKNFTLLFLMGIFGLFTTNLFAQEDATIAPENIRYWIGDGENEVIFIANWAEPDTALAWGYRFNAENVTVKEIMDGIAAADYRFSYEATDAGWLVDMHFNDGILDLSLVEEMWVSFLINGNSSWDTFDVATVAPGEYVKLGDTHCGTLVDPVNYIYVWEKEVAAVYPLANEAMIDPSEILYWVGEGEDEAIFAVNFADPEDVCYAWGYRFSTDNVTIKDMMDDIAAADSRFAFDASEEGWLNKITFDNGDLRFVLEGYNAMYNLNGAMSWLTFDQQTVVSGDFVKWGDYRIGTEIAAWTYVWETPVQPVTINTEVIENANTSLSLYPNPATSYTTLKLDGMTDDAVVSVVDLQGRVLSTFTVQQANEPVRIETAGYRAGIYFVTVSNATSRQTVKLSVQ
ncbi:MAG: T9SS type A sorting domain-containing protein [Bacteroidales bacterium]|nr:T9SS type A sorting domain-containing protein [Bacteroidales bacterium]